MEAPRRVRRGSPRSDDTQPNYRAAWRHGLKFGLRCVWCCAPLTAALLVAGVMDLRAMALVTLAICAERLLPSLRAAGAIGAILLLMGASLLLEATIPG